MPIEELLDLSMNQTLSRTVLTGVTTLLALIALYLFGGEVIRSFTFAMIFGILVGTYSSIFVAGPLLILFRLRPESVGEGREERDGAAAFRADLENLSRWRRASRSARRISPAARRSTPMAMAASASPTCRIAARSSACRPASMAGSPPIPQALEPADFERLMAEAGSVEILLVGTGTTLKPLPAAAARRCSRSPGSRADPMATGAAVRTYNVLLAEDRAVAAALVAVD